MLAVCALALGTAAAVYYWRAGLTLSHYDAKAHLVVARRVVDSLTPGWIQLGAVWLPLPHLLNLVPAQVDLFYRTGLVAVALSILSFGLLAYACTRLILDATGSRVAAVSGLSILALNPDLLYLQATPMTEPLLLGLTTMAIWSLSRWVETGGRRGAARTGTWFALACLTRYEAWPLTAGGLAVAIFALWRQGVPIGDSLRRTARLAVYPAVVIGAFLVQSRLSIGQWFVTGGFYVADNPDQGRPFKTIGSIWWASHHLNGYGVLLCSMAGAAATLASGILNRRRASTLVVLALASSAVLPWYAFFVGHPFRFRYMVPLIPAFAVWAGLGVGLTRRFRVAVAAALVALVLFETHPFDGTAPMVQEAQLDRVHSQQRRVVTAYLDDHRREEKILVSLGSLSHYVQELSNDGVRIRDVVHEGNGLLWTTALESPGAHVGWILMDELSRGGDVLSRRARRDPGFLRGFARVAEGGGVALYRRIEGPAAVNAAGPSPRT